MLPGWRGVNVVGTGVAGTGPFAMRERIAIGRSADALTVAVCRDARPHSSGASVGATAPCGRPTPWAREPKAQPLVFTGIAGGGAGGSDNLTLMPSEKMSMCGDDVPT